MSLVFLATSAAAGAAEPPRLTEDVPVLGGTTAFAAAVGITPAPDPARFVGELARIVYNSPEGKSNEVDAKIERLVKYLDVVRQFQQMLSAAQSTDGTITLAGAAEKPRRERLSRFLDFVGLRLRQQRRMYTVLPANSKSAAARVQLLKALGVDLGHLQADLNAGRAVRVQVPVEQVPVAFTAQFWSTAVFQRSVDTRELVPTILRDRNAALLARGLAGLDDATLEYLGAHPAVVTHLYDTDAGVFAAFSDSLRIRGGVVVPPGGDPAVPLWEAVLGEKVTRPDRFIGELFSHDGGRLAYLYGTLDHLDPDRRAFALGLTIRDTGIRAERFKALADVAAGGFSEWQLKPRPFGRASYDLAMLLSAVRVEAGGRPAEPREQGFWSRVFGDDSLDAPRSGAKLHEDGDIDAAWIASQVVSGALAERQLRFEQFAFAQRAFAAVADDQLPAAVVAARAYRRFPALMLVLDRMHLTKPSTFVAAARHADRLSALDANHAFPALSEFQGAIALLARLVRVGSLTPDRADSLLLALANVKVDDDGWYRRAVAEWLRGPLAQELPLRPESFDDDLLAALAGPREGGARRLVTVEGLRYRVSLADAERGRLAKFRDATGRQPLDAVLALDALAGRLAASSVSRADVQQAIREMKALSLPPVQKAMPPGLDPPKAASEVVTRAVRELSKISKPKDLKKAVDVAESLGPVVDTWLSDVLRSLVYELSLGDPSEQLGADVSRRHDFGFALTGREKELTPWALPRQQFEPGVPYHLQGAILNLELATAPQLLRHISKQQAGAAPVLSENDRASFADTAAMLDPFVMSDADADDIASAIARGRQRIHSLDSRLASAQVDAMRQETGLDGWRARAVVWSVTHKGDPLAYFSLSDLLALGRPSAADALDAWGTAALRADGCVCTEMRLPNRAALLSGRAQLGLLATQVPDLTLRVSLALHDLSLPPSLTRDVLLAATTDYISEVKPTDNDDWLTLVRTAQDWPASRIDDYVAALTAGGPLMPADEPNQPGH